MASENQKHRITILPGVYFENKFIRGEKLIKLNVPIKLTIEGIHKYLNDTKGQGILTVGVAKDLFDPNNFFDSNDPDTYKPVMPSYATDTLDTLCVKKKCVYIENLKFRFVFEGQIRDERFSLLPKLIPHPSAKSELSVWIEKDQSTAADDGPLATATDSPQVYTSRTKESFDINAQVTLENIHNQLNKTYGKGNLMVMYPVAMPESKSKNERKIEIVYKLVSFKAYCPHDSTLTYQDKVEKLGTSVLVMPLHFFLTNN